MYVLVVRFSRLYKITTIILSCIPRLNIYKTPSNAIANPHGPLTIYVKLQVAHAPGMPGTFSSPPASKKTAS